MLSSPNEGQSTMKRFLASALLLSVSTLGFVGCDQKTETKDVKTVETPGGKATETIKVEEKKSGDMKDPAPAVEPPK